MALGLGTNAGGILMGVGAGAVLVVAAVVVVPRMSGTPEPVALIAPEISAEAEADDPVVEEVTAAPEPEIAPVSVEPVSVEPMEIAPELAAPSFDVVRIEPDGSGMIAGLASGASEIDIHLDGAAIETVDVDGAGKFAGFVSIGESAGPRILSLVARVDGVETASVETVILAPSPVVIAAVEEEPEAIELGAIDPIEAPVELEVLDVPDAADVEPIEEPDTETVVAVIDNEELSEEVVVAELEAAIVPTEEVAEEIVVVEEESTVAEEVAIESVVIELAQVPDVEEVLEPVVVVESNAEIAAPIVEAENLIVEPELEVEEPVAAAVQPILLADDEGVRVIQPALEAGAGPEVMSTVALDTISYDDAGDVLLTGRANSDGFVRVYLDNTPITTSRIIEGGTWRTDLPEVDTGVYTLRIDEVDVEGEVISRIETPFKREEPAAVAEAMAEEVSEPGFRVAVRTVQPGATLWAIAEEQYGDGIQYVRVFEANKDRIRNPDLIYPGQIFTLPE